MNKVLKNFGKRCIKKQAQITRTKISKNPFSVYFDSSSGYYSLSEEEESTNESKGLSKKRDVKAINKYRESKNDQTVNTTFDIVSIDWEMVGVKAALSKQVSALARVSIVDYSGNILLDEFVKPEEEIIDYRSKYSGVYPWNMEFALPFEEARALAIDIMKNKIIVGHSLSNDFKVLKWMPDTLYISDICFSTKFTKCFARSLKIMTKTYLNRDIQIGPHDSVEDARAALDLYKLIEENEEKFVPIVKKSKNTVQQFWLQDILD